MKFATFMSNAPRGTQQLLAKQLKVTPSLIYKWRMTGHIPAEKVIALWRATNKEVHPFDIRPDLYPPDLIAELKDGIRNV